MIPMIMYFKQQTIYTYKNALQTTVQTKIQ